MTDPGVRRAGRGQRADGADVTWTIADGRRGRRWRESVVLDGHLVHSLLYETAPDRRFTHLELAAPLGLVTLHPESDGTLHGNIIRAGGVEHITALTFAPADTLFVTGSPVATAAVAWASEGRADTGRGSVVELDPGGLTVRPGEGTVVSLNDVADPDGIPILRGAEMWPLERGSDD